MSKIIRFVEKTMQLYNAVCKTCRIDTSDINEVLKDYQAIYDKTVEIQEDKEGEE